MIAKIRAAGAADVIQTGASWVEADAYLREEMLARDPEGVYVPPFDHPEIWAGNAGMIQEIAGQIGPGETPDAVVCSVGGGGLFIGMAQGLDEVYGPGKVHVVAVETRGADSLNASLRKGDLATLEKIESKATSLGARRVALRAFECALRDEVRSVVVSDAEAAMGCWRFADDQRLLCELACGASVAMCYNGGLKKVLPNLTPESKVVLIVCGGVNVSLDLLEEWRRTYADVERIATDDREVPSTLTAPSVSSS
ncbi:MAG: hypothetical protein MMC23_002194 [Stictis urceolatum]|nr:hypothetical protein [Stictis urceolata]